MHKYESAVLSLVKEGRGSTVAEISKIAKIGADSVMWALEGLAKEGLVKIERKERQVAKLTDEGRGYLGGFPEEDLIREVGATGNLQIRSVKNQIALSWAKRNGWIEIKDGMIKLNKSGQQAAAKAQYAQRRALKGISENQEMASDSDDKEIREAVETLKARGLIELKKTNVITEIAITEKGKKAEAGQDEDGVGQLTRELIAGGRWKGKQLRPYDINASTEERYPARLHPMHEFIDVIRNAWLNMGFTEVSGPIVESAFWNFDALFSPQDHPTRDMQDTFFLSNPKEIDIDDIAILNRVRKMHEEGWREEWQESVAKQALLRTHTTSVSARHIAMLSGMLEANYPVKMFSIGKVFRNESIDYKHLAEFNHTDGIIAGNDLSLANLMDTLRKFYQQLGIEDVKFKPSYFPFVEPGLEAYYYDEKLKDTIELCGAGIIRREITKAMGTDKTVLAWGMGIERLILHFLDIESLTDLYKNNVGWLRSRKELSIV
ncbi:MAG: phenylalanine--tRNA ligase subunit alpha [Candidatus Micrarchaeota archaeon]|nr:phenylalanine--tRNA ligase subunit alpha [Candidatus Micrarchaeota archaeon]